MITLLRTLHIILGTAGFILGFIAIIVAKFGQRAYLHRWIGRVYAVCMLGMSALSLPLAINSQNTFLFIIGVLTLLWVVGGWAALYRWRSARQRGARDQASRLLRTHLILMGSSYIGAWTAFLVNVEPLGTGTVFWLYAFGPSVLGTFLIARTSRRYASAGGLHRPVESI